MHSLTPPAVSGIGPGFRDVRPGNRDALAISQPLRVIARAIHRWKGNGLTYTVRVLRLGDYSSFRTDNCLKLPKVATLQATLGGKKKCLARHLAPLTAIMTAAARS